MASDGAITSGLAADPNGPAIEVAHLVKLYKTTRAVDDVSFRIARGSINGLLGAFKIFLSRLDINTQFFDLLMQLCFALAG